jgi:hypothetical protein
MGLMGITTAFPSQLALGTGLFFKASGSEFSGAPRPARVVARVVAYGVRARGGAAAAAAVRSPLCLCRRGGRGARNKAESRSAVERPSNARTTN